MELLCTVWSVCVPACTGRAAPLLRLAGKTCANTENHSVSEYSISGHTCTMHFSAQASCLLWRPNFNQVWEEDKRDRKPILSLPYRTQVLAYTQYILTPVWCLPWLSLCWSRLSVSDHTLLLYAQKETLSSISKLQNIFLCLLSLVVVWVFEEKHQLTPPCPWHRLILLHNLSFT